jgi:hypothetical protein
MPWLAPFVLGRLTQEEVAQAQVHAESQVRFSPMANFSFLNHIRIHLNASN